MEASTSLIISFVEFKRLIAGFSQRSDFLAITFNCSIMPLQKIPLIRIILLLYKKYTHLLFNQTSFFRSSIFKIIFTYCLPKLTKVKHPRKTEISLHHKTQAWKCIVNASKHTRHQSLLPIIWISCLVTLVEIEKVSIRDTVKLKSGLQTCKLVCKMCKTHCHFWSQILVHSVKACGHSHCFNERKKTVFT